MCSDGAFLSRRTFVKASALTTGAFFINTRVRAGALFQPPSSPPTTPFVQPLAFAPHMRPIESVKPFDVMPDPAAFQRYDEFVPKQYYELSVREVMGRPHPQLGLSRFSSYNGSLPGPTFMARAWDPMMVRIKNELPSEIRGFGLPEIITHLHNGNNAPESDGAPWDLYSPGTYKDHHYPNYPAAGNVNECKGTLWYHDHALDYTAQNTYRGLAGFFLMFDSIDSGNENDPNPDALRLPSGVPDGENTENCYDIPLAFADRQFDADGILTMDPFDFDGAIGDKFLVNGRVQPYFSVKRRKYRFRCVDAGPARFYDFVFSNSMEFQVIANDGNLLPHPVTVRNHTLGAGERFDMVVDFSTLPESTTEVYLVNRITHSTGRGPNSGRLPVNEAPRILKFVIEPGAVPDPSRVPSTLRQLDPLDLTGAVQREWRWTRSNGMWTVNGRLFDEHRSDATLVQGRPEIWKLSGSGGWAHPIHFHVEEGRLLSYNRRPITSGVLAGRKDVFTLFGGDEMVIGLRYNDWVGKYVMHCHNGVHEDHAMMVRFDVVKNASS